VRLTERLSRVKSELTALAAALTHRRTPWYAKAWLLLVVAYALSPIDLIPDPIPVLGYLDDVILLPLGMLLAIRLIPDDVLAECRVAPPATLPRWLAITGAVLVATAWIVSVVVGVVALRRLW